MTKKDYIKIAATFKAEEPNPESVTHTTWENLIISFADMLAEDNPQFDYDKFLLASGYKY